MQTTVTSKYINYDTNISNTCAMLVPTGSSPILTTTGTTRV